MASRSSFVKDAVPWGSAIGLQIDSVGSPGIAATEEWYKIGRDQLAPHDGYYDLRLTGELWETYYYDYLKLMVVDHPAGTEIFTDERFVVPAVKPAITTVAPPHPIAKAIDDQGTDVTEIVSKLDGKYLDTFGRGQYQGLTRDHYVEVDLGNDVPASGPLWLIAKGWLHPTDSSVNVAISQGASPKGACLSAWKFRMATEAGVPPGPTWVSRQAARRPASSTWRTSSCPARRANCACEPTWRFTGIRSSGRRACPDAQLKITQSGSIAGRSSLPRIFRGQPGQRFFS